MKISILQHVTFEGPGMILEWVETHSHQVIIYNVHMDEFPALDSFDLMIILGGPMSVHDELDWLQKEKSLIKESIDSGKLVFGICLGAQLIVDVLGGTIKKCKSSEIGWHPVNCADNFLQKELNVFHWHSEECVLPQGAELLSTSEACVTQAFVYQNNVLGLQFHLEMDENGINELIKNYPITDQGSKSIQSADEIRKYFPSIKICRDELFDLLDGFELSFLNPE